MNKFVLIMGAAALAMGGWAAIAPAQEASTQPAASTSAPTTQNEANPIYEDMVKALNLTEEQKVKLKAKFEASDKLAAQYEPKIAELMGDVESAKETKDAEKIKVAEDRLLALKIERSKKLDPWSDEFLVVLTRQQRIEWEVHNSTDFLVMVNQLDIPEDQRPKLKEKTDALARMRAEWGLKVGDLTRELEVARKANDEVWIKAIQEKINAYSTECYEDTMAAMKEVLASLSPEKMAEWEAQNNFIRMIHLPSKLSKEQMKTIHEIALDFGRAVAGMEFGDGGRGEPYQNAYNRVLEIMTPEQKASQAKWGVGFPTTSTTTITLSNSNSVQTKPAK